tara:strand:+ start:1353 stop:1688 length:336 start_codon:yes stop_codon:yes gene_type:complete
MIRQAIVWPLLATSVLLAQEPQSDTLPGATSNANVKMSPVVFPIHTQEADPEGGAYGTWAAGADYKVSFDNGASFIPYLGPDYPKNQPLRWQTDLPQFGGRLSYAATVATR